MRREYPHHDDVTKPAITRLMLRIFKLGLAAALTGLLVALVGEWALIAGAFATSHDLGTVLVGCVVDVLVSAALALTIYGFVRRAGP
jgi:hypothetical protein